MCNAIHRMNINHIPSITNHIGSMAFVVIGIPKDMFCCPLETTKWARHEHRSKWRHSFVLSSRPDLNVDQTDIRS